jgi:hypothetical protein
LEEALDDALFGKHFRQEELDRYPVVELNVPGRQDDAHRSPPDDALHPILPEKHSTLRERSIHFATPCRFVTPYKGRKAPVDKESFGRGPAARLTRVALLQGAFQALPDRNFAVPVGGGGQRRAEGIGRLADGIAAALGLM